MKSKNRPKRAAFTIVTDSVMKPLAVPFYGKPPTAVRPPLIPDLQHIPGEAIAQVHPGTAGNVYGPDR